MLSIVLLSSGNRGDLERATGILAPIVRAVRGQLVVVRPELAPAMLQPHVDAGYMTYLRVPRGTERDEMAEAAMSVVRGDLVAIRDDASVRDAEWLAPYRQALHLDDIVVDRPARVLADMTVDTRGVEPVTLPAPPALLEGTSGA